MGQCDSGVTGKARAASEVVFPHRKLLASAAWHLGVAFRRENKDVFKASILGITHNYFCFFSPGFCLPVIAFSFSCSEKRKMSQEGDFHHSLWCSDPGWGNLWLIPLDHDDWRQKVGSPHSWFPSWTYAHQHSLSQRQRGRCWFKCGPPIIPTSTAGQWSKENLSPAPASKRLQASTQPLQKPSLIAFGFHFLPFWLSKMQFMRPSSRMQLGLPWWLSGKESPANAGDMGSSPDLGRSLLPMGNEACVPQLPKPRCLEPMLSNKRKHCN